MEIIDVEEEYVVTDDGVGSWQPVTKERPSTSAPSTKRKKAKQAPSASSGPAEIEEF